MHYIRNVKILTILIILKAGSAFADCDVKSGPPVCTKVKLLSTSLNTQQATCAVTYEEVQSKKQWKVTLSTCPLFPSPLEQFIYKIAYNCNDVGSKIPVIDVIDFIDAEACRISVEQNYEKVLNSIKNIPIGTSEETLKASNFRRNSYPAPSKRGATINFYVHPGVEVQVAVEKQCLKCTNFVTTKVIRPQDVKKTTVKK